MHYYFFHYLISGASNNKNKIIQVTLQSGEQWYSKYCLYSICHVSPGVLLKVQILRRHPGPTESENLCRFWDRALKSVLNEAQQVILMHVQVC